MRKNYINPTIEIVSMQFANAILGASGDIHSTTVQELPQGGNRAPKRDLF